MRFTVKIYIVSIFLILNLSCFSQSNYFQFGPKIGYSHFFISNQIEISEQIEYENISNYGATISLGISNTILNSKIMTEFDLGYGSQSIKFNLNNLRFPSDIIINTQSHVTYNLVSNFLFISNNYLLKLSRTIYLGPQFRYNRIISKDESSIILYGYNQISESFQDSILRDSYFSLGLLLKYLLKKNINISLGYIVNYEGKNQIFSSSKNYKTEGITLIANYKF